MISLTFGKHKNEDIRLVPLNYLNWISETFAPGKVRQIVDDEINRRSGVSVKLEQPKKPQRPQQVATAKKTWQESMRGAHYQWQDRYGGSHRIPNEVKMDGREHEECPFEFV